MDTLIVQVDARHGKQGELVKSSAQGISVGRAFNNDLVLSDPYVDPQQLNFNFLDGQWMLVVAASTNPVLLNGKALNEGQIPVRDGDAILIGRTHLRVYSASHPIEKTRKLLFSGWLSQGATRPLFSIVAILLVCALSAFADFQQLSTVIKWREFASDSLVLTFIILCWAGLWSLIGRLLRHQNLFFSQLFFTAILVGTSIAISPLGGYVEYVFNNVTLGEIVSGGLFLAICTLLLRCNLALASNLKNAATVAFVVSLALLSFSYAVYIFNKVEFSQVPEYSKVLKPPLFKLTPDQTIDDYIGAYTQLFSSLALDAEEAALTPAAP